jgi:hypothetical protein
MNFEFFLDQGARWFTGLDNTSIMYELYARDSSLRSLFHSAFHTPDLTDEYAEKYILQIESVHKLIIKLGDTLDASFRLREMINGDEFDELFSDVLLELSKIFCRFILCDNLISYEEMLLPKIYPGTIDITFRTVKFNSDIPDYILHFYSESKDIIERRFYTTICLAAHRFNLSAEKLLQSNSGEYAKLDAQIIALIKNDKPASKKPRWIASERKLYFGAKLARETNRGHADFWEVLDEFEKHQWPTTVKITHCKNLKGTIRQLNLKCEFICFTTDDKQAVSWKVKSE